ncbi:MAG: hypothetical protein GXP08_13070 [Gammaproteobacteria bacterium]|nr:hypothetical protein [Gammaproteobacteria bacterium]
MPSQRVRVQVELPIETTLNSGSLVWEGRLNAGEVHELRFNVTLPKNTFAVITATASIRTSYGGQFAAHAVYRSDAAVRELHKTQSKQSLRKGRRVVEFPVR